MVDVEYYLVAPSFFLPLRYEILCLALIILPFENMLGPVRKGRDVYTCSGNPERITRTKNIIMPLARNDVTIIVLSTK